MEFGNADNYCNTRTIHLLQVAHEHSHAGPHNNLGETRLQSLAALYSAEQCASACSELNQLNASDLAGSKDVLEQMRDYFLKNSNPPGETSAHPQQLLAEHCLRLNLGFAHAGTSVSRSQLEELVDLSRSATIDRQQALWQLSDSVCQAALALNNSQLACRTGMQAVHWAKQQSSPSRLELSEFRLATALSLAAEDTKLRDHYAIARNTVISRQSSLDATTQQFVLLYSAQDFLRRNMVSSAGWILEITEPHLPYMLPTTRRLYWHLNAHYNSAQNNPIAEKHAHQHFNAINTRLILSNKPGEQAKEQALSQFVAAYEALQ